MKKESRKENFEKCSCCGGRLPQEGSAMWEAENSETGYCPGHVTEDGWCGLFEGLTDLDPE